MKTTKKAKRIIALAAALSLSAYMMAMPAGMVTYADGTHTITINDGGGYTHTQGYVAYQIFAGKFENDQLIVSGWGNGIDVSAFVSALKSNYKKTDGNNPFNIDAIKTDNTNVSTAANAQAVADVVSTLGDKTNDAEAFARLALKYSKYGNSDAAIEHKSGTGDNANKISDLPDGYYVVADKAAATKDGNSAFTLGMLIAGGDKEVSTKIGYPEVVKKVEENSEVPGYIGMGENGTNNYNDVADYNIGDSVPFKLYGTMPTNIDEYGAFYYKFTDTIAAGLTLPAADTVTVKIDGIEVKQDGNMRVKSNNTNHTIIVSFEDIKTCSPKNNGETINVTKASIVTVEYEAILNSGAVIGTSGNENSVHLSYLNNPNVEYTPNTADTTEDRPNYPYTPDNPDTTDNNEEENPTNNPSDGNPYNDKYVPPVADDKDDNSPDDGTPSDNNISKTPEDMVVVYTYELDVTKMDGSIADKKLEGAVFILSKTDGSDTKYAKIDNSNKITNWVKVDGTAPTKEQMLTSGFSTFSTLTSGSDGLIKIIGLDAGIYTLTEIKAPDSYNDPGNNNTIVFSINATMITDRQNWTSGDALTVLDVTKTGGALPNDFPTQDDQNNGIVADTHSGNTGEGTVSFTIFNTKGATLPSTGGIGTTIFLLTGGTAAGAAAILYITKKRTSANAE